MKKEIRYVITALVGIFCFFGIYMRFRHISLNQFIYFDEGYYLNFNRYFYELLLRHYPDNWADMQKAFSLWVRLSLGTGKALWFLLSDIRVFFGLYYQWSFPRILSAVAGCVTLGMIFLFGKRYYESKWAGLLGMCILAVLPGHVFYSRLAIQEAFSTLCFLCGFYFYIFPRRLNYRTFLSAVFFAGAWFTNYRLITLPAHILVCEVYLAWTEGRFPDIRKYIWHILTFFSLIFLIGNLDNAQNTVIVFAWIFHQSELAHHKFDFFNFLSFPYYLFRLENVLFGLFFFGNVYFLVRRKWKKLLPFLLSGLHMFIYSFSAEKGARYLCVIFPFLVLSVAWLFVFLFNEYRDKRFQAALGFVLVLMMLGLTAKSMAVYKARTDYQTVIEDLKKIEARPKMMATQSYVLNLYTEDREDAKPFPYKFRDFMNLHAAGYNYLVIGPQAYVSWVPDLERFTPELKDFPQFIVSNIKPIKVYDHFDQVVLERFVLDHNENLRRSLAFLKESRKKGYGQLKVYDVGQILRLIDRLVGIKNIRLNPAYEDNRPSDKYGR